MKTRRGRRTERRRPPPRVAALAAAALLAAWGCAPDAPGNVEWAVTVDTLPGGVVHVLNTPPESGIEPTWTLEPEVRIGSVGGDGPETFGQVKGFAALPDGRIAVLDAQAQEIRIFGPDGRHVRTLGRRGEGPGELADANGMVAGPDGLLRVNDPRNARLSIFDPEAGLVGSEPLEVSSWGFVWTAAVGPDGRVYEPTTAFLGEEPWRVVKVYDAQGVWADTIRLSEYEPSPSSEDPPGAFRFESGTVRGFIGVPFWPTVARAIDPRGFFWVKRADVNEYRFVQTTFEGDTLLVVESRRPPRPVAAAERDSAIAAIRERVEQPLDWSRIPGEKPIVQGMVLDDAGRIWVQVLASDTTTTYDIFGRDGRYRGTAVLPLRVQTSVPPVIVDDRFLALYTDELGVPYVLKARIEEAVPGGTP